MDKIRLCITRYYKSASPHNKATYRAPEIEHFVDLGQDDPDDGADVDDGDGRDHYELADGLLEPGHAALAGDARPQRGDRHGQGDDQELEKKREGQ